MMSIGEAFKGVLQEPPGYREDSRAMAEMAVQDIRRACDDLRELAGAPYVRENPGEFWDCVQQARECTRRLEEAWIGKDGMKFTNLEERK